MLVLPIAGLIWFFLAINCKRRVWICLSTVVLIDLAFLSPVIIRRYNFKFAPVNIEECTFVISFSISAWRSYLNWLSTTLLLWKIWEQNKYVLISLPTPSFSVNMNYAGTPSSIFVFILGCFGFRLKLYLALKFIVCFSVKFCPTFLTVLQSKFFSTIM